MSIVVKKFLSVLDVQGKRRTMILLRSLPEHQLRDVGVSPELLAMGVKAYPWQLPESVATVYAKAPVTNLSAVRVGKIDRVDTRVAEQSAA